MFSLILVSRSYTFPSTMKKLCLFPNWTKTMQNGLSRNLILHLSLTRLLPFPPWFRLMKKKLLSSSTSRQTRPLLKTISATIKRQKSSIKQSICLGCSHRTLKWWWASWRKQVTKISQSLIQSLSNWLWISSGELTPKTFSFEDWYISLFICLEFYLTLSSLPLNKSKINHRAIWVLRLYLELWAWFSSWFSSETNWFKWEQEWLNTLQETSGIFSISCNSLLTVHTSWWASFMTRQLMWTSVFSVLSYSSSW